MDIIDDSHMSQLLIMLAATGEEFSKLATTGTGSPWTVEMPVRKIRAAFDASGKLNTLESTVTTILVSQEKAVAIKSPNKISDTVSTDMEKFISMLVTGARGDEFRKRKTAINTGCWEVDITNKNIVVIFGAGGKFGYMRLK